MIRCKCWAKTYMLASPTSSMKKGWLCRISCDKKNLEVAPVLIQIEWWSRSSNDDPTVMIQIERWSRSRSRSSDDPDPVQWWWSRSRDDPDPVMMIQIERWSKSSDDVPWWSRSSDDPDLMMMSSDDLDRVMIQIQWWCPEMIQIEWWSRSNDEDELKIKMTWRWRGLEYDEDSMMI